MPTFHLNGPNGTSFSVSPEGKSISIGRHPENAVCLQDELLSRFHCVVEPDGSGGIRVRDLGSRNGTKVNGQKISDAPLTIGDVLRLGTFEFTVDVEATLKERQVEARKNAPITDAPWVSDLRELIDMLPPKGGLDDKVVMIDGRGKPTEALDQQSSGPVAVRLLLLAASKSRATDIHIEPKGETAHVRLRVDGQMVSVLDLPNQVCDLAFGLIKNACQFQTASKDSVLDGHISAKLHNAAAVGGARRVDYRVSFTPSMHGQKLVVRILDARDAPRSLGELDLPPYMHERIKRVTMQDAGMLMVCGPTGSGKTTTLYNALREIDRSTKNVVTIEDPVEYHLDGVTQIPIDEKKGNTFGSLLRSVLRQDPDVILVGEIRDEETASTAMRAAMTGHLVFSTVHAKDTMSSVFRLLDLKVEAYLVANSLELILAQRLVRLLCENCKRPVPVSPAQATRMGRFLENQKQVYVATGCAQCLRTGYRGRRALFELLDFTDELRDVVLAGATINSMKKVIETGLFTTLVQSGWQLVARGATTMEEVDRVASGR